MLIKTLMCLALGIANTPVLLCTGDESILHSAQQSNPRTIVVENASVRYRDRVKLCFERGGVVANLFAKEGDFVEVNQRLAQLQDQVALRAYAIAEAEAGSDVELRLSQKKSESAKHEYQLVLSANAVNPKAFIVSEVLRLRLAMESAEIEVELQAYKMKLAELKKNQAAAELDTYCLSAPFPGIVTKVQRNIGESVNPQEALIELVNPNHVCVEGYVDMQSSLKIFPGDHVEVQVEQGTPELRSKSVSGVLRFVDMSLQPVRGVVRVIADFDNSSLALREGMTARMTIGAPMNDRQSTPTTAN